MAKFKRQWEKDYKGHKGYQPKGISLTQPSQGISMSEMMKNNTRQAIESTRNKESEVYLEDTEMPRIDDLTDLEEFRKKIKYGKMKLMEEVRNEGIEAELIRERRKSQDQIERDKIGRDYIKTLEAKKEKDSKKSVTN